MNATRFHSLNTFFRNTFGEKVYKISLTGGFTCPVRDGTISKGGCVFCNPLGNVPFHYEPGMPLSVQLERSSSWVRERHGVNSFLAYFQDYTTTWADTSKLEELYREALDFPGVRGLALCTRPDSISPDTLSLLEDLSKETFLWVELGVQSGCDFTLLRMRRGHTVYDSEKAFENLHSRGIRTSAHVILGFPGESREEALSTAELVLASGTAGVKLQNLHVLRDTPLERDYTAGRAKLLTLEEYTVLAADFLEIIRPDIVVQRLAGEAPGSMLVAPEWAENKLAVHNSVMQELSERNSWQGSRLGYILEDIPRVR